MTWAWIIGGAAVFATLIIFAWRGRHLSKASSGQGDRELWGPAALWLTPIPAFTIIQAIVVIISTAVQAGTAAAIPARD